MKKRFSSLILALILLLSYAQLTFAQEEPANPAYEEVPSEEGTNSGFSNLKDRIRLMFTFNPENKAEKAIEIAEYRLAFAEKIAEEDPEAAEKAKERYEEFMDKAKNALEKSEEREVSEPKTAEERLKRLEEIKFRIEKNRIRAIEAHDRILERLKEKGASEEQLKKLEEIFSRFEERAKLTEEELDQRKDRLENRLESRQDLTDEEIAAIKERLEEERSNKANLLEERKKILAEKILANEERVDEKRLNLALRLYELEENAPLDLDIPETRMEEDVVPNKEDYKDSPRNLKERVRTAYLERLKSSPPEETERKTIRTSPEGNINREQEAARQKSQ